MATRFEVHGTSSLLLLAYRSGLVCVLAACGSAPPDDGATESISEALQVTAVYDSTLQVPACAGLGSLCTSGSNLTGRGSTEPHAPNTLYGSCSDTDGTDTSINRLLVFTVNGTNFGAGKAVRAQATLTTRSLVWSDVVDFFYTPNVVTPVWQLIGTMSITTIPSQTLVSPSFVLAPGTQQAVRAQLRPSLYTPQPCIGAIEEDDLVFPLQ